MLTNINSNFNAKHDEQQQNVRSLETKINTMNSKQEEVVTSLEGDVTAKEKVRSIYVIKVC